MRSELQAIKKPTCVGFFIEQNLLSVLRVQQELQQLEQQLEQELQQLEPQPGQKPVLLQQVQGPVLVPVQQQVQELQTCHKRSMTGPAGQQPEQNFSFIYLSSIINGYKKHT